MVFQVILKELRSDGSGNFLEVGYAMGALGAELTLHLYGMFSTLKRMSWLSRVLIM
jgi:hypothetical protein